ncbi:homothallic switching endonuclease [Monosporozyma servazzii]
MFEGNTQIIMENGDLKYISDITPHSYVMCEDGDVTKINSLHRDLQTTFQITQVTKHTEENHIRKQIFHRINFSCSLGHILPLSVPSLPKLERSLKHQKYLVKTKKLIDFQTNDGRIIIIPKDQSISFPLSIEGEYQARNYMKAIENEQPEFIDFALELRDLDYLNSHMRVVTEMRYSPILSGNGTLSKYLTGQKEISTPSVLSMSWLLGLWIGDGTTRHPEISMDSHDRSLWDGLIENVSPWGIIPSYKDATIPLRAKHVKLYYGTGDSSRKHQMYTTNNPFWKCLVNLEFKNKDSGMKQIPSFMWHESVEIREYFLSGLIDADGYVGYGQKDNDIFGVSIQTIYSSVMDGIVHIGRSLGIKVSVTTKPERKNIIEGRTVQCKFTYECNLVGGSPLQNVLAKCKSHHKTRPQPSTVIREPIRFRFTEQKRGLNWVYGIQTDKDKLILLGNNIVASSCNNQHCHKEQKKSSPEKILRRCKVCSKVSARCYYKDWTGRHNLCCRCRSRYVSTGYRCLECHYVPDQRSLKKLVQKQLPLNCGRCQGSYFHDPVRGPIRETSKIALNPPAVLPRISSITA